MTNKSTPAEEPVYAFASLARLWPDGAIAGLLALIGGFFESPVLLALAVYAALILARDTVCVVARRHGQGHRAHRYEFGTGKLEQAANLVLAAIKVAAGLWLAYLVLADGRMLRPVPTQGELGLFALLSALYFIRCAGAAWIGRGGAETRLRPIGGSAGTRLLVAVSFQAAITVAVIVQDPVIAGAALSAGILLLAFALLMSGMRQSRNAVLDLVDHPPDSATGAAIQAVVASLKPEHEGSIVDLRARRAGNELFVELTVAAEPHVEFDEVRRRIARLRAKFKTALPGSDVVIRLSSEPFVSAGSRR